MVTPSSALVRPMVQDANDDDCNKGQDDEDEGEEDARDAQRAGMVSAKITLYVSTVQTVTMKQAVAGIHDDLVPTVRLQACLYVVAPLTRHTVPMQSKP
jgi:hypothetical protein